MKRLIMLILALFVLLTLPANAADLTSAGSSGATVTATTQLKNAPAFTVSIPSGIPIGALTRTAESTLHSTAFSVSVSDTAALSGRVVTVTLSAPADRFYLYNSVYELPYEVRIDGVQAPLTGGGVFAHFTESSNKTVSGSIVVDRADITANGTYSGTLIFTVTTKTGE